MNRQMRLGLGIGMIVSMLALAACDGDTPGTNGSSAKTMDSAAPERAAGNEFAEADAVIDEIGDSGAAISPGKAPSRQGVSPAVKQGLPAALLLPRAVAMSVTSSRGMIVEAVYYATAMSGAGQFGQVTSTGTIDVTQAGAQYQPTPADKLVVNMGGMKHEFVLKNAQGNNAAGTAAEWLLAPHILQYTHTMADQAEAEVSVQFDGQRFEATVKGWAMLAGRKFDVDMGASGGTAGARDFRGQDTQTQYTLTGTITGEGMEIGVNEQHTVAVVSQNLPGMLQSQRGSASQFNAIVNNSLTCEGRTYVFQGLRAQLNMKDKGGNQSSDLVGLEGTILRDGQPFATCGLQSGIPIAMASQEVIRLDGAAQP